jgi:hypothetical protein
MLQIASVTEATPSHWDITQGNRDLRAWLCSGRDCHHPSNIGLEQSGILSIAEQVSICQLCRISVVVYVLARIYNR